LNARARTVFLGTGEFAVPIVAALADHPAAELVAVVTAPPRTGSRGKPAEPPVARWAADRDTTLLRPEKLRAPESVAEIRDLQPELLVLADYGQIVPAALLDLPRFGALNLHPSLLPRHRGATPIPAAILAGDTDTGVTLMRMDAGLDTGPIVAQWRTSLSGTETAPELERELADQAARLLTTTLEHWLNGDITPDPQHEPDATLTRPLRRSDGRLDPHKTADELERQVRAYQPWPGSYLEIGNDRLVVWRAHAVDAPQPDLEIGDLWRSEDGSLALRVGDRGLQVDELQPAGGRPMASADYLRGRPTLVNEETI
jgi:methionyl-tRNA formyltransferase